jgi:outer membrane protein assembly factor BamE
MRRLPIPLLVAAALLGGCAEQLRNSDSFLGVITPYRVDIVQGNVVTKEQLERVKPGMTRAQVRDVLGTPLIADPFHAARWDYVFTIRRPGTEPQRRSVLVLFEDDRLASVEAPELPSEREFTASITPPRAAGEPKKLELTPAERDALPPPAPVAESPETPPLGPARAYPPLEKS